MATFEINGERYEIPVLDSFDMDEAELLYDYCGTVLEDFAPADPDGPEEEQRQTEREQLARVKNPKFKRALLHVAYRRRHPELSDLEIRGAIGSANMLDVTVAVFVGDADDPPVSSQTPHENGSDESRTVTEKSSGISSAPGSSAPDTPPESIGTGVSATSVPEFIRGTSVS